MQRSPRQKGEKTQGVAVNSKERKQMKQMVNRCETVEEKQEHQAKYWQLNKAVKKSTRKDKQNYINDLATQAEET